MDKPCTLSFAIADAFNGTVLKGEMLYKKDTNGEWVGKKSVQRKDLSVEWFENTDPNDIDTRYYNLDGTKK